MTHDAQNQATADMIVAADASASPNGFGATVDQAPGLMANPLALAAAAFVGGFLLGRLVRPSDA
jgi:hypothetical protein